VSVLIIWVALEYITALFTSVKECMVYIKGICGSH